MQSEDVAGILAVPIWLAGTAAAVFVVAILLAVKRAGGVALITSVFRVGLIAAGVLGAWWLYVQQRDVSERRALDDRKTALMAGSIAPGSALSCLDELAGETVDFACEKAVFASPEAVASAVKYVTAQLALLIDGTAYVARGDAAYASELAPLRTAIELDRFGLVAQVLKERDGCTVERCDALARLRDSTRVLGNLRERTFEEQVKKYTAIWNAPRPATGVVAAAGPSVALPGTSGLETVASLPRDPAAAEPAALGSVASPPQEQLPLGGIVVAPPQGPPPLPRNPAAAEPASQSAAVTPPTAPGSVTSPPQEPLPLRGTVTPTPKEAAAEPASRSAAVTPPAAPGSVTPLPPRRPPQVRVATPPRAVPQP